MITRVNLCAFVVRFFYLFKQALRKRTGKPIAAFLVFPFPFGLGSASMAIYGHESAILDHDLGNEAATVPNLVLIEQAAQQSEYNADHIRYLARKGFISGQKIGGIWLVDLNSLKEYEAKMKAEGTKKFGSTKYREN